MEGLKEEEVSSATIISYDKALSIGGSLIVCLSQNT